MPFTKNRAAFAVTLGLSSLLAVGAGLSARAQVQPPPVTPPVTPPATPPVTPPVTTPPVETPPATTPPATTTLPAAGAPTTPLSVPEATLDPVAKQIITQMVAAHKALNSYSATITSTLQSATNPVVNLKALVSYAKPNKAIASVDIAKVGHQVYQTDGAQRFATNTKTPQTYAKAPATPGIDNIGATLQPSRASASGILPLLITDNDASTKLMQGAKTLAVAPDSTIDAVPVDVVKAVTPGPNGAALTIEISAGKQDHLLRRLDLTLAAATPDQTLHITETYTDVKANPTLAPAVFAFTPTPGMKLATAPAAPAESTESAEPKGYDARIKVGVKPLPFAGTDLAGKSVNLAAYKGKVVLLDFWATWCSPCRDEIPNVVAAYKKFHPKGFDVVGISLDHAEDKAKLVSYTKEHAMPWRQVFDGNFWDNSTAKSYGVQAIPFSVLIGKDGKIIAVNPRGPELDPAVKAALAK